MEDGRPRPSVPANNSLSLVEINLLESQALQQAGDG